jgi:phosphoglycolate phosphatase-like HAD superfamily hydrolase
MRNLRVALFDVDGVLLDSLGPHLRICEDKSQEYGLGLRIPGPREFKELARGDRKVSPMKYLFMAIGFPEEFAERANLQYQAVFMTKYSPTPFPCVHSTLRALYEAGLQMGIVTSNIKANIAGALGQSMEFFQPDCIFSKDNTVEMSKQEAICAALARFQADPRETIFVGDQLSDWEAAKAAGVHFLGAAYGWGISDDDKDFPIVHDVSEMCRYILERAAGKQRSPTG